MSASIVQPVPVQPSPDPTAPSVARAIQSSQTREIQGRSTVLQVLGADDQGEKQLTYTWTVEDRPDGNNPIFQFNGTNRAKSTSVRFDRAGDYTLRVDIVDRDGKTASERVQLRVVPMVSRIALASSDTQSVAGSAVGIVRTATPTFSVEARDQFGQLMDNVPGVSWTLDRSPKGSKPALTPDIDTATLQLDRGGVYRLRATVGRFSATTTFEAIPAVSRVDFLVDGAQIPLGQGLQIPSTQQRLAVQGFDQFGYKWNQPVDWQWTGTSTTSGQSTVVQSNGSQADIQFSGPGNYEITVGAGALTRTLAVTVASNPGLSTTATAINPSPTKIAAGRQIRVANGAELRLALRNAQGGDTILLRGGVNYGALNLYKPVKKFDGMVTVQSENSSDRATLDWINLVDVQNLKVEGVNVITLNRFAAVTITGSTNIILRNSLVTANLDPYLRDQTLRRGVDLRNSDNVKFEGNVFEGLSTGFGVTNSSFIDVAGNTFQNNLADNLNLGSNVSDVVVSGNTFHSQLAKLFPEHHYDNIQLWVQTDATRNSSNITITRNTIFDLTGAVKAQAIFGRGDVFDANGIPNPYGFENVEISHNVIVTQQTHGITMTDAKGLRIINNTLLYGGDHRDEASSVNVPGISARLSTDVLIANNILPTKHGYPIQDSETFRNNTLYNLQSGEAAEFLVNPFNTNPTRQDFATIDNAYTRNADGSRRGAQMELSQANRPTAIISSTRELKSGQFAYTFDASQSLPAIGKDLQGAQYRWRFADGTQATGLRVEKSFDQAGEQDVTLVVTDRFGQQHTLVKQRVMIRDAKAVAANFDQSLDDMTSTRTTLAPSGKSTFVQRTPSNRAIVLGEEQGHLYFSPNDPGLSEIPKTRQLTIAASIQANAGENTKPLPVAARHGVWSVHLRSDGNIQASIGAKRYSFKPSVPLMDGKWHEVAMTVTDQSFQFYIDGAKVYSIAITREQSAAFFQDGGYGIGIGGSGPWATSRAGTRFQLDNLYIGAAALTDSQIAAMALRNTLV